MTDVLNILAAAKEPVSTDGGLIQQIGASLQADWALVGAQTVIFLIVIAVLYKFALGPIVAVLEERKNKIADADAQAEKIKSQLSDAEAERKALISKANEDAARIVGEAKSSAEKIAETKAAEAETNAAAIVARAEAQAQADKDAASAEIKEHFGKLLANATTAVTGKVLNDQDQARINEEAAASVK